MGPVICAYAFVDLQLLDIFDTRSCIRRSRMLEEAVFTLSHSSFFIPSTLSVHADMFDVRDLQGGGPA